MSKKQTAVQWLEGEFDKFLKWHEGHHRAKEYTLQKFSEQFKRAFAMEREQIEEAFKHGDYPCLGGGLLSANEYYTETYGE